MRSETVLFIFPLQQNPSSNPVFCVNWHMSWGRKQEGGGHGVIVMTNPLHATMPTLSWGTVPFSVVTLVCLIRLKAPKTSLSFPVKQRWATK